MIDNFEPLQPGSLWELQSASQRLQHIRGSKFTDAFGHVVAKQWRVGTAAGRDTWAVVDSALECELLWSDIVNKGASDGRTIRKGSILIGKGDPGWELSGAGKMKIITFDNLVSFLTTRFLKGWRWKSKFGSPTIVMNFGWGSITSDMALLCLGVAKLIDEDLGAAVRACTVSSGNCKPFGNGDR